jgi:hypothetical protein
MNFPLVDAFYLSILRSANTSSYLPLHNHRHLFQSTLHTKHVPISARPSLSSRPGDESGRPDHFGWPDEGDDTAGCGEFFLFVFMSMRVQGKLAFTGFGLVGCMHTRCSLSSIQVTLSLLLPLTCPPLPPSLPLPPPPPFDPPFSLSLLTPSPQIVQKSSHVCGNLMRAAPNSSSDIHHHGAQDTIVYAVSGVGCIVSEGGIYFPFPFPSSPLAIPPFPPFPPSLPPPPSNAPQEQNARPSNQVTGRSSQPTRSTKRRMRGRRRWCGLLSGAQGEFQL